MKTLGNEIYIQRGETWSLDFAVKNDKGDPYMLFSEWNNPYLAITVTAARYEQKGDFRRTWWLDMNNRWVEQEDGTFVMVPMKRFTETNALFTMTHTVEDAIINYPRITANGDTTKPYDVTHFLFYTEPNGDGVRIYKYCISYGEEEVWEDYDFRIIKQFNTKDWTEQNYLFDIKILAGESVDEHIYGILTQQEATDIPALPWEDEVTIVQIKRITDWKVRKLMQEIFDSGQPLMPDYDTKSLVLQPTKLSVSTNIQGGIR